MDLIEPAADIEGGFFGFSNFSNVVLLLEVSRLLDCKHGAWCNSSLSLMNPGSFEV